VPTAATLLVTLLAMAAFAGNSLLCRAALRHTAIDPASFTALRLLAGAVATGALLGRARPGGSWGSAAALFVYAAGFSFAYLTLPAGVGALLLFLAVQATMVLGGLRRGEGMGLAQGAGLALAAAGLGILLLPGLAAPPLGGALRMLGAGAAWGLYSLRGLGSPDPGADTAGNFLRALPLVLLLALANLPRLKVDLAGALYAVLSGALASGLGYVLWYRALKGLRASAAASVQLSVPILAALAGVAILGEPFSLRLGLASAAILGGIALVLGRP
jgi:drug/metabolite transporter (DMT)-like permease